MKAGSDTGNTQKYQTPPDVGIISIKTETTSIAEYFVIAGSRLFVLIIH